MKTYVFAFLLSFAAIAALTEGPQLCVAQTDTATGYTDSRCVECHEDAADDNAVSVHKETACLACHLRAFEEDHEELPAVDCIRCHAPHDEKIIGDAHARVDCKACHQKDGVAVFDPKSGRVILGGSALSEQNPRPHQLVVEKGDSVCRSCHFEGNALGASSMVLPPKSVLCMPCHVATFSVCDTTTVAALLVFAAGMIGLCTVWFSGRKGERADQGGRKLRGGLRPLATAIIEDVFLIKRLYALSPARWFAHALIYYPILMRAFFGMAALILSLTFPETDLAQAMLDKNNPVRGLFFDLTGLMIATGILAALFRPEDDRGQVADLPVPGRAMTALLGIVVLAGFMLEGLRISMAAWPDGSQYALAGYVIGFLLRDIDAISDIYGYAWYAHAIFTGAFIALIPFTRMVHIIVAPVLMVAEARSRIPSITDSGGKCRRLG